MGLLTRRERRRPSPIIEPDHESDRDGGELYFVNDKRQLIAVPISDRTPPQIGTPSRLFEIPAVITSDAPGYPYDVAPDGQRFIVLQPPSAVSDRALTVVLNWRPADAR